MERIAHLPLKTKVAIVHDYLCSKGGSERVFQYICEAFPEADVYTLSFRPEKTFPYFANRPIRTTWLQPFVRSSRAFRWTFPMGTLAIQSFDFSDYDLIVSSSTTVAKYLSAGGAFHICYCYMPTRALWHFDHYFGSRWLAQFLKPVLPLLKKRDFAAAQKVDRFLTISQSSQTYIREYYKRDSEVLYCPIDARQFSFSAKKKNHYLIVSRLEHWKRVDYAIEAFNILGLPLKVIGTGSEEEKLRRLAKENISFLGEVDDATLAREYSECKAIVFTPFLEYGLIPLEANASGTPVIAYGHGGIRETMIPVGDLQGRRPTALFFYEQTAEALIASIQKFETLEFDPLLLREHALQWDSSAFIPKFREKVLSLYSKMDRFE